jgi:transposase
MFIVFVHYNDRGLLAFTFSMLQLDNSTRAALVRNYYQNGNSASAGLRKFKTEKGLAKDPCSVSTVSRLVEKFETFGCICDLPRSGRPTFSEDEISAVKDEVEAQKSSSELHITSCRSVAESLQLPLMSVHKIMRVHLRLKPYHLHHLQSLKESDFIDRQQFAEWFLQKCVDDPIFLENVMWSDEAHFYLHGQVATRNCIIWETENPHAFTTTPLHSPKVTVWCAFTAKCMLPPFFFTANVNGANYLQMLTSHLKPNLPRHWQHITFQQDGAPPHIALPVRAFLTETFREQVISRMFPQKWPPRSPDLNPADYWLWGHLKHNVYSRQPKSLDQLQQFIEEEVAAISNEVRRSAVFNLVDRLNMLLQLKGGHIEHVF